MINDKNEPTTNELEAGSDESSEDINRKQYLEASSEEINWKRRKKQQLQIMDLDTVMFSERRVNPEIWDFHWVGGCHKESTRKQNKKEYDKLVEEASTKKG